MSLRLKRRYSTWIPWPALWAGFLLLLALPLPATGQAAPLPIDTFWEWVGETQAWLETNPPPQEWETQARRWSGVGEIAWPDGQVIPVNTRGLVDLLRAQPPEPARVQAYLAALQKARAEWPSARDASHEQAVLKAILARPEFEKKKDSSGPLDNLVKRIADFIRKFANDLFTNTVRLGTAVPTWISISLALLLLVAILAFIFRDTWRNIVSEAGVAEEAHGEGEMLSSQQASRRAQQLSGSGDYRLAVRYLYLSALLLLDERGLLRYNRSLTNREYLRQVSGQPGLVEHLRVVIDTFDRVWYGFQPIDELSYARYSEHVAALEEQP